MNDEFIDKILCMDCVEGLKKLKNNSIDLVLTDPPYGISRQLNCKGKRLGTTAKLDFDFGDWDKFNEDWIELAIQKTRGWFGSFCAKKDIGIYWDFLERNKFVAIDVIVWQKPDPVPLNAKSRFLNAWEAIVVGKRPNAHWGSNYQHNIIKYQAPKNGKRVHPTQKPIGLISDLIKLTTKEGDVVCDPFIGSGTTAIAAKLLKRHYIGFEISKQYCELSKKRLNEEASQELLV